jgi:hypothetical protein
MSGGADPNSGRLFCCRLRQWWGYKAQGLWDLNLKHFGLTFPIHIEICGNPIDGLMINTYDYIALIWRDGSRYERAANRANRVSDLCDHHHVNELPGQPK